MRVGILCSRIRVEEKLLLAELERRNVEVVRLDDDQVVFDLNGGRFGPDGGGFVRLSRAHAAGPTTGRRADR